MNKQIKRLLILGFFLLSISAFSSHTKAAVSRNPGEVQYSSYDNTYYVYAKAGETLTFEAITKNNGNKNVNITLTPPVGSTHSQVSMPINNGVLTGMSFDFTPGGIVSDVDGVWQISALNNMGPGSGSTYFSFLYQIHLYDGGSNEILGRVWTENYKLFQVGIGEANTLENLQLWHKTVDGYLYQTEYRNYNGVYSEIVSDAIGLTKTADPDCLPANQSYRYSLLPGNLPTFETLRNVPTCSSIVNSYKIFIDEPNSDLPESVILPSGNETWLNRSIQSITADLQQTSLSNTSHAAQFDYEISNFEGIVEIQIDTNMNGLYNDPGDVTIEQVYKYGELQSYTWDGKDAFGNDVPITQGVNVRLFGKRAGEIHFVSRDVERRSGGAEVTRLLGNNNLNTKNIYWNDVPLNLQACTSVLEDYSVNGIDSTGGVHAWNNTVDCIYNNPLDLKTQDNTSLGDGNYIHEWTYETINKEFVKTQVLGQSADLSFKKEVSDENGDQKVSSGEKFTYTLSVHNSGTTSAENLLIKDSLSAISEFVENGEHPEQIIVQLNSNLQNDLGVISLKQIMDGYTINVAAGETIDIVFELQLKTGLFLEEIKDVDGQPSNQLMNVASMESPTGITIEESVSITADLPSRGNSNGGPETSDLNNSNKYILLLIGGSLTLCVIFIRKSFKYHVIEE